MPQWPAVMPEVDLSGQDEVEIFEFFLGEDFYALVRKEMVRYAASKGKKEFNPPSQSELKVFIAVLLLSGYHEVPGRRHYWEQADDVNVSAVSSAMSRNRFEELLSVLHLADNARLDKTDKMAKLRPMFDLLVPKFQAAFPVQQDLDVDESMIPYFGKHSCKQFLRGKPIRFGFKAWCLNSPDGYVINFAVYQGATKEKTDYDQGYGKCGATVLRLLDGLPDRLKKLPFHVYMDNLFTGLPLLKELKRRGYGATGTVRINRLPADTPLKTVAEMKKEPRGTMSSATDATNKITVVRWHDNAVVTAASTIAGTNPLHHATRWSSKDKKKVALPQPKVLDMYNNGMQGTDRMDQNVACYRVGIRIRKWWWAIFAWLLGVTVQNAWMIKRKEDPDCSQLKFIRTIVI